MATKHGITLILAYIPTHSNVEADYVSLQSLLLEWHLLSHIAPADQLNMDINKGSNIFKLQAGFQLLSQLEVIFGILTYGSMSVSLHLGESHYF